MHLGDPSLADKNRLYESSQCLIQPRPVRWAQTQTDIEFLPIIPIDDDTRAMLAYAASPEGRARIEQARQELEDDEGVIVTPGYFDEMKRRVAQRCKGAPSIDA